ncbi:MAG: LysR family transcriptional regulator [Kiritimatiellae bacterium]|nr:LysR family transcriptional regulator [Kiritimatiellia bacterium]
MSAPRKTDFSPGMKLWLSTPRAEGVFGDGKWRLLDAIERNGSLRAAAESLQMSYRKAWGDLKKAERCLGEDLIAKSRGGPNHGGTCLTQAGKRWLQTYSRFRTDVEKAVHRAYRRHFPK